MNKAFEKILDKLEELRETYDEMAFIEMNTNGHTLDFEYAKGKKDVMIDVKEIVREVAEEYKGGWIPCSERLPEEPNTTGYAEEDYFDGKLTEYIVMILGAKKSTTLYYAGDGHWYDVTSQEYYPVIAWQPLPEYCNKNLSTCADCENAPCDLTPEKRKTNADRIRSMSDYDLAMNAMCPNKNGLAEIECDQSDDCNCYECILNWLKQEDTET